MLAKSVALALAVASTDAFMPGLRVPGLAPASSLRAVARRPPAIVSLRAQSYLDDMNDKSKKMQYTKDGRALMPDVDYTGFIDADGFDGGDGQVGVVGDGSNAMETFDNRETFDSRSNDVVATIGSQERGKVSGGSSGDRIDKRWNAWGSDSADDTYKDALKETGVTDMDIYGEDKKTVTRQQYENWANQQRQWGAERSKRDADAAAGAEKRQKATGDYFDHLNSGGDNNKLTDKELENVIFATGAKGVDNSELLIKTDWKPCKQHATRVDGEVTVMAESLETFILEPNSMVSEQFIARFTDDSCKNFVVAKEKYDMGDSHIEGYLPRRGTPVEFTIRYRPSGPVGEPETATLVIDQEDGWKWTYKVTGKH